MRAFGDLFEEIDTTTSTQLKLAAIVRYLRSAEPRDAAWTVYILSGRRLKRFIGPARLHEWLVTESGFPAWLVEETRADVGDLAETIALLMDARRDPPQAVADAADTPLADWIETRLLPLRGADLEVQRAAIVTWWRTLEYRECFLVNKLLTGELRVGVAATLVTRAIAEVSGLARDDVAGRLIGDWSPSAEFWLATIDPESQAASSSRPYPFMLAAPLEADPATLGAARDFIVEWKWDGIRSQLVRRADEVHLWSRGEDLITERFPEIVAGAQALPSGTVLDGEILAWTHRVQPFNALQQRIGRKKLSAAMLSSVPVRFLAYDLLELDGIDLRARPFAERREHLESLVLPPGSIFERSPVVEDLDWEALAELRAESRSRGVEGFMIKRRDAPYVAGRRIGLWWKWKIDPYSFDGVLLYAEPGHGRRSNLYTDYTFGAWRGEELVPVAKAYSGLSDREIATLDRWIRAHTREKFGPVRSVEPVQVFEIAFEGIAASPRHKSGIALRFPRIARWRTDKPAAEADRIEALEQLLIAHLDGHAVSS